MVPRGEGQRGRGRRRRGGGSSGEETGPLGGGREGVRGSGSWGGLGRLGSGRGSVHTSGEIGGGQGIKECGIEDAPAGAWWKRGRGSLTIKGRCRWWAFTETDLGNLGRSLSKRVRSLCRFDITSSNFSFFYIFLLLFLTQVAKFSVTDGSLNKLHLRLGRCCCLSLPESNTRSFFHFHSEFSLFLFFPYKKKKNPS